ncbi:MAG: NAD(P)H-dependent oxidoreductase subunit E [Chloroflexi bacterium]|nr:NAD(P)H-dependent oxidoreductase subunit E [Chloroflexota bacterium]
MTPEELTQLATAERAKLGAYAHRINVCTATACHSSGGDQIKANLLAEVKARGIEKSCQIAGTGCRGLCTAGPMVSVEPESVLYQHVTPDDAPALLDSLTSGPVERLRASTEDPFYTRQHRIVLEHAGEIDPERIEDYIAAGGYSGLAKALYAMTPQGAIDEITASGLRGRGGAGFPTGLKWRTVAKGAGSQKYVICNGDEGDPGAFMDRSVLESDPHRVIEGMAIAGYAVGAQDGYLYVRAEYPLAIKRLTTAIRQARQRNLLGEQILGTPFTFNVEIRLGAGAFVCGEETALIASIEGARGNPRPRPPYPAESGLWGCPTLINNVETFANVAPILRNGGAWFAGIGTEKSKGTKVFALTGRVKNTGLIEVPMGISLREIIYDIGGGVPDGHGFKAIQTGGPSGGCIPASLLDSSVDYESLTRLGSIMGSGGMIVMDDTSSMVEVAQYFMEFCMTESCGKCIPCRVGTVQMHRLLTKFVEKRATPHDLELLEQLCDLTKNTSLCGLGQSAPNPVLSTLRYFRDEYLAGLGGTEPGQELAGQQNANDEEVQVPA